MTLERIKPVSVLTIYMGREYSIIICKVCRAVLRYREISRSKSVLTVTNNRVYENSIAVIYAISLGNYYIAQVRLSGSLHYKLQKQVKNYLFYDFIQNKQIHKSWQ